jgi:hypothetical protein
MDRSEGMKLVHKPAHVLVLGYSLSQIQSFFPSLEIDRGGSVCTLETITSHSLEFLSICMLEDHVIQNTFYFGSVTQFHFI